MQQEQMQSLNHEEEAEEEDQEVRVVKEIASREEGITNREEDQKEKVQGEDQEAESQAILEEGQNRGVEEEVQAVLKVLVEVALVALEEDLDLKTEEGLETDQVQEMFVLEEVDLVQVREERELEGDVILVEGVERPNRRRPHSSILR